MSAVGIAGITGLVPDRALPDGWHAAGADLRTRGGELRAASRWPSWSGRSADAAAARLRVIADDLDVTGAAVGVVAVVVEAHVAALALIRATVTAALARVAGLTVGDDGTLTGPGPATAGPGAVIGPVLRAAVRAVAAADGLAARTVTLAVPPPAPVSTAPLALASTSPDPVTAARDTLTARGLDLPVTVLGADGTPAPGGDPGPGARRAVVVGDPDTAATLTTLVSGVGSTGPGGDATAAAWAASLARPGHAVVAWQGYDAPTSLSVAVADAPAVAGGRTLREFQRSLRARHPRARLSVTGYSYGSVVVGRAAGDRADPLEADGVPLEGSPGVDAASAADLRLHATDGRPEVQVRRLPGDLIRLATGPVAGVHGRDPASPAFGAAGGATSAAEDLRDRLLDGYLWSRSEWAAHGGYRALTDPGVGDPAGAGGGDGDTTGAGGGAGSGAAAPADGAGTGPGGGGTGPGRVSGPGSGGTAPAPARPPP
ncbi:alpha/beta hydrolase [Corynebacterium bovis]|uniref:alpha/beta hydrolase n=1 Tax=Corynebacterium bovis TaxID=36808 RepID=UPI003138E069